MRIPRNATKLKVTFKVQTSAHSIGDTAVVSNEKGYWSDGTYQYCVGTLRNSDICSIEVLERKEN